jgi:hypothetical protein
MSGFGKMREEWRFRALIREIGGTAAVAHCINKDYLGFEGVAYETVKGWNTRNSIPSSYLPFLIMYAIDKGYIKDVKFLRPRGKNDL